MKKKVHDVKPGKAKGEMPRADSVRGDKDGYKRTDTVITVSSHRLSLSELKRGKR